MANLAAAKERVLGARWKTCLWAALTALMLSACSGFPESRVALSEPGSVPFDQSLVGHWFCPGDGNPVLYLQVNAAEEAEVLDVVWIWLFQPGGEQEPLYWWRAKAHAAEVDGKTYFSAKRVAGTGDDHSLEEPPAYIIARAILSDDDRLSLGLMQREWVQEQLDKDELKGRKVGARNKSGEFSYLLLELSRPELIALVRETPDEDLFDYSGPCFQRLLP